MGDPQRTCVGCRSRRSQPEMIRLHLDGERRLRVDRNGPGRGAWLCRDTVLVCFDVAAETKGFERALRHQAQPASLSKLRHQFEHTSRHV